MKYYIIAGEASGDLHASNLMKELKKQDRSAVFRCWGGDLMEALGCTLVKHYRKLAFMGFLEVLLNIRTIMKNLKFCRNDILSWKPDVLILVDYPGFNLRIAEFASRQGIRVFYYISPQVWAWKKSRVHKIKKHVERMYVILPFEKDFYAGYDYEVDFVGHPLLDAIDAAPVDRGEGLPDLQSGIKPVIAVLPGSRKQEIKFNLPVMLSLVDKMPQYQFVIAGAPSLNMADYEPYLGKSRVNVVFNQTQSLLRNSTVSVVTSGTATLEAALLNTPEVVCYRGSTLSMLIAWMVIRIKYISLVNLIMDREVVKELIQFKLNPNSLFSEVSCLLPGKQSRNEMIDQFAALRTKLGEEGTSNRVANFIVEFITQN